MVVLIVDNSIAIVDRLAELLQETGKALTIEKAFSYKEAKKILAGTTPDIVLLDMNLPGSKSLTLLKEYRSRYPLTKMFLLTSRVNRSIEKHFVAAGADFIFDKYHDFESIPLIIQHLINVREKNGDCNGK